MEKKKLSTVLPRQKFQKIVGGFAKMRIAVLGDLILDNFVMGDIRRISPEAPVPVVEVKREQFILGGAGNVARTIRSLGGGVLLFGAVGRDENGRILNGLLDAETIERLLVEHDRVPTITKTRIIVRTQQVVRIDREEKQVLSAAQAEKIAATLKARAAELDGLVISDYGKGFVTPALIAAARSLAARGTVLTVDPKIEHFSYYRNVTCITPNRMEAAAGMRRQEPETREEVMLLGNRIMKHLRCAHLLITLGRDGMALFDRTGGIYHIPTVAREVFDVTGAGDTVIAVLTMALARGATALEAAVIANFAAGVVVGKLGTASCSAEELAIAYGRDASSSQLERYR